MIEGYPYELRLPEAPYRFEWRSEAAVDASKHATDRYAEERYTYADGTVTVIREYRSDGTFHIISDRGEIELIDNAQDPYSPDPVSVVRLPGAEAIQARSPRPEGAEPVAGLGAQTRAARASSSARSVPSQPNRGAGRPGNTR